MRRIRALSILTLAATYLLIVLGSTVRVTNSGMGCVGWPLCSGKALPISQLHPLLEQSHRYLATIATVLIAALCVMVMRVGREAHHLRGPALVGAGMIVVQIVLGAITVVTYNAPVTVALHLLVATMFLGIVTVAAVASYIGPEQSWSLLHRPGALAWVAVGALYVAVISGSVVVDGGAEAACKSWPMCLASKAPSGLVAIQYAHRSMVLIASVLVVAYVFSLLTRKRAQGAERTLALSAVVLLAVQVFVGALSALQDAPAGIADVHLALAEALWVVVVAVFALSARAEATRVTRVPADTGSVGEEAVPSTARP